MARKGKEAQEQTSRLESLRDDCRRHPSAPIPLWRFEGEKFEIGGEGAERKRALSALDRLGAILAESTPGRPAELRRDRALAVEAVLKGIPFRADIAIASHLEGQETDKTSALCRQRVPDVLASVAELCDAMLRGVKPRQEEGGKRRLRRSQALWIGGTMNDDIVARLREFDADLTKEIENGEHGKEGEDWVIPFDCLCEAADEIERLRAERDDARREVCEWVAMMTRQKPSTAAKQRGWDCFKEAKP